eukprot:TRINITY_DN1197_c0_g1_i6.p1 TRINITY_DN1197_c0_g1~~TRINITY_DN1197_c0_g1_i6.p1  ORF type:complete len:251 (-),score=11.33 TRINITY_DN1197_c0_g1_i6:261-1013(-)
MFGGFRYGFMCGLSSAFAGTSLAIFQALPRIYLKQIFDGRIRSLFGLGRNRRSLGPISYNARLIFSGVLNGGIILLFLHPLNVIRTRLVLDSCAAIPRHGLVPVLTAWNCLTSVIRDEGISNLYSGIWVSIAGIVVYRAAYFGFYALSRQLFPRSRNIFLSYVRSYAVVMMAGLASYPVGTIGKCMMISGDSVGTTISTLAKEGTYGSAFFKGAGTNILRGIFASLLMSSVSALYSSRRVQQHTPQQPPH